MIDQKLLNLKIQSSWTFINYISLKDKNINKRIKINKNWTIFYMIDFVLGGTLESHLNPLFLFVKIFRYCFIYFKKRYILFHDSFSMEILSYPLQGTQRWLLFSWAHCIYLCASHSNRLTQYKWRPIRLMGLTGIIFIIFLLGVLFVPKKEKGI